MDMKNSSNGTVHNNEIISTYPQSFVIIMSVILIVVIIVAFTGNGMVILTVIRHRRMRTRTNMFITNLAVSDMLTSIFDMPISLITLIKGEWVLGNVMCQFNGFTMALFLITSIHTLMCISIHKYINISRPFSRFMTKRRILIMIICTWLWSFIYGISAVLGWNPSIFKAGATQCGPSIPKDLTTKTHSLVNTFVNFVLPLTILSICYYKTFKEIRCHMIRMLNTSNMNYRNTVMQQKKIAVTLFLVMACFVLSFLPYVGYSCAAAFYKDENKHKIPPILNPVSYWFIYVNCAWNPILYAIRSTAFRQGYKEIICGKSFNYFSAGSFRSTSQRSWSFRSSVKSSANCTDKVCRSSLRGPMIHPSNMRSLKKGSSGVLPALEITNNHRSPVIAFADNVKTCSPKHMTNLLDSTSPVQVILSEDDTSNNPLLKSLTCNDEMNENKNPIDVENGKNNTDDIEQYHPVENNETGSNEEDTFYDSDVELEHVVNRRKYRQQRRRKSKSMYARNPGGTVSHLVQAQAKLMNVNDYLSKPRPSITRPRSMSDLTPNEFKSINAARSAVDITHYQNPWLQPDNLNSHSAESLKKSFISSPKLSLSKRLATSLGLFRSKESNLSAQSKSSSQETKN